MSIRKASALGALAAGIVLATALSSQGQGKGSDSVVKTQATADKAGADGKQVITITLDVDPNVHRVFSERSVGRCNATGPRTSQSPVLDKRSMVVTGTANGIVGRL